MISSTASHPSGWKVRIRIHLGSVISGLVESRQFLFDIWGETVNVATRFEKAGLPQTLTCSSDTYGMPRNLVKARSLGLVELKGKGTQEIVAIESIQRGS